MLFTRTFAFTLLCLAASVPAAPTDSQHQFRSSLANLNKLESLDVIARPIGTLSANRRNFDLFFIFTFVVARSPSKISQMIAKGKDPDLPMPTPSLKMPKPKPKPKSMRSTIIMILFLTFTFNLRARF